MYFVLIKNHLNMSWTACLNIQTNCYYAFFVTLLILKCKYVYEKHPARRRGPVVDIYQT